MAGMKSFKINGKVWRWTNSSGSTEGGWYFVYVNEKLSQQIRDTTRNEKKVGLHFIRVKATVGKTNWNTTLFPTSAKGGEAGPISSCHQSRRGHKEGIDEGDAVKTSCTLL